MSESNEKFWTVHGGSGCRYPKPEGAGDEAEYLAKKNPGHAFWVMESVISAKTSGALTWTEAKVRDEPSPPPGGQNGGAKLARP